MHPAPFRTTTISLATLALLAGCAASPPAPPPPRTAERAPARPAAGGRQVVVAASGGAYLLTVPPEWPEGSYRFEKAAEGDLPLRYGGAMSAIRVLYLPDGDRASFPVASLRRYSPEAWERLERSASFPPGRVVAVSEGSVFVASVVPENPFDPDSEDGIRYARMRDRLFLLWDSLSVPAGIQRREAP